MDKNGGNVTRLTHNPASDSFPSWGIQAGYESYPGSGGW